MKALFIRNIAFVLLLSLPKTVISKNRLKMQRGAKTIQCNKYSTGSASWLSLLATSTPKTFCTETWSQRTFCWRKTTRQKLRISVFQKCWTTLLTWLKLRQELHITCHLRFAWVKSMTISQTCGCWVVSSTSCAPSGDPLRATAWIKCSTKSRRKAIQNCRPNSRQFTTN